MEPHLSTRPHRLLARPWLLAFVPINAATAGFGVVLPLLILIPLHGAWTIVALAATIYNAAVILSSVVWGWVADRFPGRRNLLVLNYLGFAVLYLGLGEIHSVALLLALYTVVGAIAPAGSNASNLLILETFGSDERPGAFASFQLVSMLGSIGGLLAGFVWLQDGLPLSPLLDLLALLALVSVAAVWFGVRDAARTVRAASLARHPDSLVSRLRPRHAAGHNSIPFFPRLPDVSVAGWRRFRRWIAEEAHHELPLILAASFLFNLSANLFNISYTPYLFAIGLGAASIFLVNLANNAAQAFVYPASGTQTTRRGPGRLVRDASYARALGYLAVAGFTFVPLAVAVALFANLVAYAVMGVAIAFYSTASSILLFRSLEGRDAGTLIGVSSALGGIAAVAGAGLSDLLSVSGSYRITFLVAAGGLLASLPIWTAASVAAARRRGEPAVVAGSPSPSARPPPVGAAQRD